MFIRFSGESNEGFVKDSPKTGRKLPAFFALIFSPALRVITFDKTERPFKYSQVTPTERLGYVELD